MPRFRKKIVAGNWKMHKTQADAQALAAAVIEELGGCTEADIVLCPPFTALKVVGDAILDTNIRLGAQNMHPEPEGAYTGEISANMLRDLYCWYVIVGHSERRSHFGETDAFVNQKVKAALAASLIPIVCVGETLQEREAGQTYEVVRGQVLGSLDGLKEELAKVVVAYEPVWAIGTGRTATPEQAQDVHAFIRSVLAEMSSPEIAQATRIQYGGSIKPSHAGDLFAQPDIDGGLVGGASLEARPFIEIVRKAF